MRMFLFALLLMVAPRPGWTAEPRELLASGWLVFNEARVRLVVETPRPGERELSGGVEVRLRPDFKTYWRHAGDSGVPPNFDFSGSAGLGPVKIAFPFPSAFDDGAGGIAIGYKASLIFPFSAPILGPQPEPVLSLDFAVCGTLCIPLAGTVAFRAAEARPVSHNEAKALKLARARVPVVLTEAEAGRNILAQRLAVPEKKLFRLEIASPADPAAFALFAEAKGYLQVSRVARLGENRLAVDLAGTPAPGSGGAFGPVRLTFGHGDQAFEALIDLDGAPMKP